MTIDSRLTTPTLFFDTETSAFMNKKIPFDDPHQAWCVQIGAVLDVPVKDSKEDSKVTELNVLIQANGRTMNYHAQKIHGITVEQSDVEGIPEVEATSKFAELLMLNPTIVCHNYDFDWPFVYQMMQRNLEELSDEHRSKFYMNYDSFCTMKNPKVKAYVDARNVKGHRKMPKLIELHEKLFNTDFKGAHDAMADIRATRRCYYELIDQGII
ncbi:MAG: 3'-5' exonuclease [Planctomycetes bacterium]|nr:3'-5' exonuclease [Planctomycetota bacterium]